MPTIHSKINTNSSEFKDNLAFNLDVVADLKNLINKISLGGGEASQARHKNRGKLLPRERIAQLLDEGSPFLEVGQLAAHEVYGEEVPCAGVVAGMVKCPVLNA